MPLSEDSESLKKLVELIQVDNAQQLVLEDLSDEYHNFLWENICRYNAIKCFESLKSTYFSSFQIKHVLVAAQYDAVKIFEVVEQSSINLLDSPDMGGIALIPEIVFSTAIISDAPQVVAFLLKKFSVVPNAITALGQEKLTQALLIAAKTNAGKVMTALLTERPDLNPNERLEGMSGDWTTALLTAASHNADKAVAAILAARPDLNPNERVEVLPGQSTTALLVAASNNADKAITAILQARPGVDVNAVVETKPGSRMTALLIAAAKNADKAVTTLLEAYPDMDVNARVEFMQGHWTTVLLMAASNNADKAVTAILKARPDIDVNAGVETRQGQWTTALLMAAVKNAGEAISALLAHPEIDPTVRVEVNQGEWYTALLAALSSNADKAIPALLAHPSLDVNAKVEVGENKWTTALIDAVNNDSVKAVTALLAHPNIDANARVKINENEWSTALFRAADHIDEKIITLFIAKNINVYEELNVDDVHIGSVFSVLIESWYCQKEDLQEQLNDPQNQAQHEKLQGELQTLELKFFQVLTILIQYRLYTPSKRSPSDFTPAVTALYQDCLKLHENLFKASCFLSLYKTDSFLAPPLSLLAGELVELIAMDIYFFPGFLSFNAKKTLKEVIVVAEKITNDRFEHQLDIVAALVLRYFTQNLPLDKILHTFTQGWRNNLFDKIKLYLRSSLDKNARCLQSTEQRQELAKNMMTQCEDLSSESLRQFFSLPCLFKAVPKRLQLAEEEQRALAPSKKMIADDVVIKLAICMVNAWCLNKGILSNDYLLIRKKTILKKFKQKICIDALQDIKKQSQHLLNELIDISWEKIMVSDLTYQSVYNALVEAEETLLSVKQVFSP